MAINSSLAASAQVVRTEGFKYPINTIVMPGYGYYETPDGRRFRIDNDAPMGSGAPSNLAAFKDSPSYLGP